MLNRNSTAIVGALLCASLMFVASPATSQSFYGSLVSVVRDAQGGVIPAATIVLTNTATSERREGVSAENGEYRFVNLVPGTYRLEVERQCWVTWQSAFEQPLHDQARQPAHDRQIGDQRGELRAKLAHDLVGQRRLRLGPHAAHRRRWQRYR